MQKCSRKMYYIAMDHNIKIILHGDILQLSTTCSRIQVIQYVNTNNSLNVLRKIVPRFGFLIQEIKYFYPPYNLPVMISLWLHIPNYIVT